jgi:signal transduction histidine kinase
VKRPSFVIAWLFGALLGAAALLGYLQSTRSAVEANVRIVVLAVSAVPLLLARRRPVLAVATMVAGTVVATLIVQPHAAADVRVVQFLAADVTVAVVAAVHGSRFAGFAAGATFLAQLAAIAAFPVFDFPTATAFAALALSTAAMIGISTHQRGRRIEAERSQAAADAVVAERLRIAREVHDMVAHSIAVIAIQAGVGRRVMRTQPEEASNALDTIEVTSRETLAGLRRTLSALRQGGAPLDPLPTLADLEKLAESTSHAGVTVDLVRLGVPRELPEEIGLSAYRIIQEAVSNVVRHAGAARCRVTVDYREGEVAVEVVDEGRGCADPAAGYGLVGMRERAELLGGTFTAGLRPEGGFRVAATLPAGAA